MKRTMILLLCVVLMISVASAWEFDNSLQTTGKTSAGYPELVIKNAFGLGSDLIKMQIVENTRECLTDCHADINMTLYQDGNLPFAFDFVNKDRKAKSLNYNYLILVSDTKDIITPHFKTVCTLTNFPNGTSYNVCNEVNDYNTTNKVTTYDWKKYKNETLPAGTYTIRIEGKKAPMESIDWSFGLIGIPSSEVRRHWAWWDSNWANRRIYNFTDTLPIPQNRSGENAEYKELWVNGSSGTIANCSKEIRVIRNDATETPFDVVIDDAGLNDACKIGFMVDKQATEGSAAYFIYYNNPTAVAPTYTAITLSSSIFNNGVINGTFGNTAQNIAKFARTVNGNNIVSDSSGFPCLLNTATAYAYCGSTGGGAPSSTVITGGNAKASISFIASTYYVTYNFYKGTDYMDLVINATANDYYLRDYSYAGKNATNLVNETQLGTGITVSAFTQSWTAVQPTSARQYLYFHLTNDTSNYANTNYLGMGTDNNRIYLCGDSGGNVGASSCAKGKLIPLRVRLTNPEQYGSRFNASWVRALDNTYRIPLNVSIGSETSAASMTVTLVSPSNNTFTNSTPYAFACNATSQGIELGNETFYIWDSTSALLTTQTNNFTGFNNQTNFSYAFPSEQRYYWNCKASTSDGTMSAFDVSNRTIVYDITKPTLRLYAPTETFFQTSNNQYNISINVTSSDTYLQTCTYKLDCGCDSGTCTLPVTSVTAYTCNTNISQSLTTFGNCTYTFTANDSASNTNSTTWNYFLNNVTLPTFSMPGSALTGENISVQYNVSSLKILSASATINYYTSNYTMQSVYNLTSATFNYTVPAPGIAIGPYPNFIMLTINGRNYTTNVVNQITTNPQFILCNGSINVPYFNISFYDESTLAVLNASLESAVFDYTIGNTPGMQYTFQNTTDNRQYSFCFNPPDKTIVVNATIKYSSTTGGTYPARTVIVAGETVTNASVLHSLPLLSSTSGLYVSFQTIEGVGTPVSGVGLVATRIIGGLPFTIEQGVTDSSGIVTFFLNPNYQHTIVATKSGYQTSTLTITPSQSSYTILMTSSSANVSYNYSLAGVKWYFTPKVGQLRAGNISFAFNLTSTRPEIIDCKMEILNMSNGVLASVNGKDNSTACNLYLNYTVTSGQKLKGRYSVATDRTGGGYVVLDADNYWIFYDVNATDWTTLTNFLTSFRDLPEWGTDDNRQNYSRVVGFFFLLILAVGIFTFFTGYDLSNPGATIWIVTPFIFLAGIAGWFRLDSFTVHYPGQTGALAFLDSYMIAIISFFIAVGYAFNYLRRQS